MRWLLRVTIAAVLGGMVAMLLDAMVRRRAAALLGLHPCASIEHVAESVDWRAGAPEVAHALGGIEGRTYTNSREALLASHAAGFRVFEIDLAFTSDDSLVATHDWTTLRHAWRPLRPTWRAFLATPTRGGHRPLDVAHALALLDSLPDATLVLDAKDDVAATLTAVVSAAHGDSALLGRVVPQLYHRCDVAVARRVHPWRSTILTLYRWDADDAEVLETVTRAGIGTVTLPQGRFSASLAHALAERGVAVYVHTVNDSSTAAALRRAGAAGVYTDAERPL